MKIRTDFVTNSSSSSFVLSLKIELENGKNIEWNGSGCLEDGCIVTANKSPKELGEANDINQLIELIKDSIQNHLGEVYEGAPDEPIIDDETKIVKELKEIKSMDEIKKITIEGYEDTLNDYDGTSEARDEIITYNLKEKSLEEIVYGINGNLDCEGSSGELLFDTKCKECETPRDYFMSKRDKYFDSDFEYDYPLDDESDY